MKGSNDEGKNLNGFWLYILSVHVYLAFTFYIFNRKILIITFFLRNISFFQKKETHELSKAKHLRFKVYNFQFVKLNIHVKK